MLLIFKKSILFRIFVYFALFGLLILALYVYFYSADWHSIPVTILGGILGGFLLFFILVYLYEIVRPLEIILVQMKALLSGRIYKRIYTDRLDEIGIIANFFNEITKSFEKASHEIKEGKRLMNELEIAAQIQSEILPIKNPKIPGLDVVTKSRSAVELGGDIFDFMTVGGNTYIFIGDVTGHGVPAAIVMVMVHTILHSIIEFYDNAYSLLIKTNSILKQRIRSTMFMTLLMLRWDHKEQKMTYVGAGHEHLVVYKASLGKCVVTKTGGIALGMVVDNSKLIKEIDIPLEIDDVIILYSDGLTEGKNMTGEMYGLDRIIKATEIYAPQYDSEGIVHRIALDFAHFVQDHIQDDDVTLISIKYVGVGQEKDNSSLNISSWANASNSKNNVNAQSSASAEFVD